MIHRKRLNRLFRKLGGKVDAVLIFGDVQLLRFLTGHGEGSAIARRRGVEFVVHRMFVEAAKETGMRVHVYGKRNEYRALVRKMLSGAKTIGLRFSEVRHSLFLDLRKQFRGFKLVDVTKDISEAFLQKDPEEIVLLKKACRYAAEAAKAVPSMLRSRMTETELMKEISYHMPAIGGGMVSFGENTSHPHHQPGSRRLKKGDLVMVDFGCTVGGVGSDITRTFCYGRASKQQKDVYTEVRRALVMAFNMIKEKRELADINKVVNTMFEKDGYGPFIHSIGHSLGYFTTSFLAVEGQVLTVEPGIYVPGMGGVRIEDDVLITKSGMANLTKIAPSKELIEV